MTNEMPTKKTFKACIVKSLICDFECGFASHRYICAGKIFYQNVTFFINSIN